MEVPAGVGMVGVRNVSTVWEYRDPRGPWAAYNATVDAHQRDVPRIMAILNETAMDGEMAGFLRNEGVYYPYNNSALAVYYRGASLPMAQVRSAPYLSIQLFSCKPGTVPVVFCSPWSHRTHPAVLCGGCLRWDSRGSPLGRQVQGD